VVVHLANIGLQTDAAVDELIAVLAEFRTVARLVDEVGRVIAQALLSGGKVLTCGNGGSATDASHMAEELVGRYKGERRSLPAVSLAVDSALITCIANDFGYEYVFSRQIEGLAQRGDVVICFSTSGNSPNTLNAVEAARQSGATSVAVLGKRGGLMAGRADYEVIVQSDTTARIQEVHTLILHLWLELIEAEFAR
jgi:D-sedoheptulose 7-phosphate isomerase